MSAQFPTLFLIAKVRSISVALLFSLRTESQVPWVCLLFSNGLSASTPSVEEMGSFIDGQYVPPDISKPNPNGIEFDNFYIDMNGVIHNCCHNENLDKVPLNDDDMFNNIFL